MTLDEPLRGRVKRGLRHIILGEQNTILWVEIWWRAALATGIQSWVDAQCTPGCSCSVMPCSTHHYNPEVTLPALYVHQWWPAALHTSLT